MSASSLSTDQFYDCIEFIVGASFVIIGVLYHIMHHEVEEEPKPKLSLPRGAVGSLMGRRPTMEDAHSIAESVLNGKYKLYAVYDGHGGTRASIYLQNSFPAAVEKYAAETEDMEEILRKAIAQMEDEFMKIASEEQIEDGTTVVCALVGNGKVVVANVGDSEAILYRSQKPLLLTTIHNPKRNEAEVSRITSAGGRIIKGRLGHPHLNPQYFNIAVSRAIGDLMYKSAVYTNGKESGMVATPDVQVESLGEDDDLLILACDGVWDVLGYQEAYDLVRKTYDDTKDLQVAVDALVNKSFEMNSLDNITACVVLLKENES